MKKQSASLPEMTADEMLDYLVLYHWEAYLVLCRIFLGTETLVSAKYYARLLGKTPFVCKPHRSWFTVFKNWLNRESGEIRFICRAIEKNDERSVHYLTADFTKAIEKINDTRGLPAPAFCSQKS